MFFPKPLVELIFFPRFTFLRKSTSGTTEEGSDDMQIGFIAVGNNTKLKGKRK